LLALPRHAEKLICNKPEQIRETLAAVLPDFLI
jgi:hypothetical protein